MNRREQLRTLYGFDFPEDFFRFWEFANKVRPLEPLLALEDPLRLTLVGPFDVLAGKFDGRTPRHSQWLHWRYHDDPPEFFTVLTGGTDGLHYGYFFDDPAQQRTSCVAYYYTNDAYQLADAGNDLFETVRAEIEEAHAAVVLDFGYGLIEEAAHDARLAALDAFRRKLRPFEKQELDERGDGYHHVAPPVVRRKRLAAKTKDGMGVVTHPELYRSLVPDDKALWRRIKKNEDLPGLVEEARQALAEGYPATALKVGKDLWAFGGPERNEAAYQLLQAGYEALGRKLLIEVLGAHKANRDLPSVDILSEQP